MNKGVKIMNKGVKIMANIKWELSGIAFIILFTIGCHFWVKWEISSDQPSAAQTEPLLQKHNKNQSYIGYHLSTDTDEPKSDDSSVSSVGLK